MKIIVIQASTIEQFDFARTVLVDFLLRFALLDSVVAFSQRLSSAVPLQRVERSPSNFMSDQGQVRATDECRNEVFAV